MLSYCKKFLLKVARSSACYSQSVMSKDVKMLYKGF